MYKLLIMDDERQIREGMKKIIPWQQYGFEICAEAANGVEGLKQIEKYHPQAVFADIRMPVMDGIEFLEELKKRKENCDVVVLSGYSDYELVRKAMKSGAVDYLTKPSGKEDLIQVLEDLTERIEAHRSYKMESDKNLELMKQNVLYRLAHNQISSMELRSRAELLEMELPVGECRIAVAVRQDEEPLGIYNRGVTSELYRQGKAGEQMKPAVHCFNDEKGRVCFLATGLRKQENEFRFRSYLEKFLSCASEEFVGDIAIAVGTKAKTYRSVWKSYDSAIKALEYQFAFGNGEILDYDKIQEYVSRQDTQFHINGNEFREVLQRGDRNEIENYVKEIFRDYHEKTAVADPYLLKSGAVELAILSFQRFEDQHYKESNGIYHMKAHVMKKIGGARTLDEMQQIILDNIWKILDKIEKSRNEEYSRPVADAIQHILMDYANQDLSLQTLSEKIHVNAVYLGRVFKKETGSSFNDYLNNVRVEKAKELLTTTNYKGNELYEKVGFSNYNYFYIVFKKITGVKPTEYRK